ncbi:cytochrome c [Emcibacter sp. SYSU 3D8]|uniref:c-type cytochrome n=1 Tax=Emcibacter sp. SYSU 3D8 TaxID=3133969 RepID=UPI0031FEF85A
MNRTMSILAAVLALASSHALAADSSEAGDPPIPGASYSPAEQGADLAQMWCNACHVTGTSANESAMDAAPPFKMLAPMVTTNPDHYRTFLTRPHGSMKEITLSRDEIEAVLAYISSLDEPAGN